MEPQRKISVKNRISVLRLRPEKIHGVKVIKFVHKLSADFCNPSSSRSEPLFWKGNICGEDGSYIDVPESLKRISSVIDAEDIYTFKELRIDGKSMPFEKNIRYINSNKIKMQVTSDKIAEPKRTYHVSYVDEGLCEYDDYYGEVGRSSLEGATIIVEKPESLRVDCSLTAAENATLNVLENSPRLYCAEIRGKLTSGNGFAVYWKKAGTIQCTSQKPSLDIPRILVCSGFVMFLGFLTMSIITQNNPWLLANVATNIIVAFLVLIYAFSPQHAHEIIHALMDIRNWRPRKRPRQERKGRLTHLNSGKHDEKTMRAQTERNLAKKAAKKGEVSS